MRLPMFPLGTALMPGMPISLRLFEPRYLAMIDAMLTGGSRQMGVVLIERGHEVGGGDARFDVGTLAHVVEVQQDGDVVWLAGAGGRRFVVEAWLDDDPWPQADVTVLPDLPWDPQEQDLLDRTEEIVRDVLREASAHVPVSWDPDVELADDPVDRCWQLCGIALIQQLDQIELLRAETVPQLLGTLTEHTRSALEYVQISGGSA